MTKEKSQLKELIEVVSVFQWVLTFLFMGELSLSLPSLTCEEGESLTVQSVYGEIPPRANPRPLFLTRHAHPPCCPGPAGVGCLVLMVYLTFTSLWPISTLYFIWLVKDWRTPERGTWKYRGAPWWNYRGPSNSAV